MLTKKCRICGKIFGLSKEDKRITLCERCAKKNFYIPVKREKGTCLYCGKGFIKNRKDQKYCSNEHRKLYYNELYFDKNKKYKKVCPWCKEEFTTTNKLKEYCSNEHYRRAKSNRESKNRAKEKKQRNR